MVDIRALRYYNCIRYLKSFLYLKLKGMIKLKFNEKLIKLRKASGLSQEELGDKLNVSRQTISKWELGETTPEMDKLGELSNLFEISIDELVKDNAIPNTIIKEIDQRKVESLYKDSQNVKSVIRIYLVIGTGILIFFALIVICGIFFVK